MKLPLKERESLLDKLIVWFLGVPGAEVKRLEKLYKEKSISDEDWEYIKTQIRKRPELRKKYQDLL